ncbi:Zinc finger RanBP2-type [Trinorchestia longiramus]|nr:Zinc finger RanBP2-type [Trinorchestia longiramus]
MEKASSEASMSTTTTTGCAVDSSSHITEEIIINGRVRNNPFGYPAETRKRRSRLSSHSRSCEQENHAKKSSLLKIFSWFQGKVKRSDSLGTCSRTTEGSVSTLSGSIPDNIFVPLSKSRSADNQSILDQSVSKQRKNVSRCIHRSSSFTENNSSSNTISGGTGSVKSEDTSSCDQKKRTAPLPPSPGGVRAEGHCPEDVPNSRPKKERQDPSLNDAECASSFNKNIEARKDAVRIKRKAPEPPSNAVPYHGKLQSHEMPRSASATTEMFNSSINSEQKAQSIPSTLRSTTSQSSVRCSMSSNSSIQSIHGGDTGNIPDSSSSTKSGVDSCSKFLKPWYKRRTKSKIAKVSQKHDVIDQVYEFWRPELQFNDGKISASPNSQSPCGTVQSEKSVLQKVVKSCKAKRKSQISVLTNVSQLNLETEIALKREKTMNNKEENLEDPNSPKTRFLTQQDVTQSNKPSPGKLNTTANSQGFLLERSNNERENRTQLQETSSQVQEFSSHTKLIQVNKNITTQEIASNSCQASEMNHYDNQRAPVSKESYSFNKSKPLTSPSQSPSLIQMANLDAEQFYKLAKDIKTPLGKSPSPPAQKTRTRGGMEPVSRPNIGEPPKSNRNFGLRMNQLFAPDVSVILEASESVTSSGTVPHDDCFSDQNSVLTRNFDCIYEDLSVRNDSLFDNRLLTANAREIMEELADVRQEIERINEEENEAEHKKFKIDERRSVSERINEACSRIQHSHEASSPNANNRTPPALDGTPRPEAKLRWECCACTLINVPWKITCEACTSRRPTNPVRIAEDGTRLTPSKTDLEDQGCELTFTEIDDRMKEQIFAETGVRMKHTESERPISELMKAEKQTQWELELRKYFGAKDFSKGVQEKSQESIVIFNKVDKKLEQSGAGLEIKTKVTDSEPNLSEVRIARLQKFERQENNQLIDSHGNAAQRTAPSKNGSFKQEFSGPGSENEMEAFLFQCNKDKNFYKNDAPKRLIMSPAGAVKNTIHIFDQKPETENQNEKISKVKQNRRKSVGLVKTQASLFEKNDLNFDSENTNVKGFAKNIQDHKQAMKNSEVDITSAISKFDEIAAMAEIERLKPMLFKPNVTKPRKKIIIHTKEDSNQFVTLNRVQMNNDQQVANSVNRLKDESDLPRKDIQQGQQFQNTDSGQQQNSRSDLTHNMNKDYEPVIGMGETEADTSLQRDSASFLSSSFDLMEVSEFQQIEAEHSQRGSPITSFYEDAFQADYDSDSTELFMDASSADMSEAGYEENASPTSVSRSDPLHRRLQALEGEMQQRLAVEELSHQLTLKNGIADFKATMSAESSGWSATSTMNISHLLKKLEAAIGRGDHSDAANLARELATLKVSCSVTGGRREHVDTASNVTYARCNPSYDLQSRTTSQNNMLEVKQQHAHVNSTSSTAANNVNAFQKVETRQEAQFQGFLDDSVVYRPGTQTVLNNEVTIRDHKSSSDRRKVKSDTVSKLIDTTASDTAANTAAFRVQLFVEDRSSHQGPLSITVTASMTVGELRSVVFEKFGFPPAVQRWILGRRLAEDDNATLAQHKVTREGCPLFLYLVAPPTSATSVQQHEDNAAKTPEIARPPAAAQKHTDNQRQGSTSNNSPNVLISPLAASKNPFKLGRYAPSAPAEDPVVGNELIRREMNEQELQSQSSRSSHPKNITPIKDVSSANADKFRGQAVAPVSRKDVPLTKSVQAVQTEQTAVKIEKKSPSQSKMSRTARQNSNEQKLEKTPGTDGHPATELKQKKERYVSAHSSNAHPSNVHPSNAHPSNAHPSNAHPSNAHPSNAHPSKAHSSNAAHPSNAHSNTRSSNVHSSISNNSNAASSPSSSNGWSCSRCTFVNDERRPGCEVCGSEKPSEGLDSAFHNGNADEFKQLDRAVSALDKDALVKCTEGFECRVCFTDVAPREGVVLRECLHVFCRECLANAVRYSDTAAVKCLYRDDNYSCDATIQDREVKALVSVAEYEAHLNKSVKQAAVSMQNVFHCKTPDCRGFCVFEDNVNTFLCSVCYRQNCLTCQAQHTGLSCKKYQEMISQKEDIDSLKTQKFFEDMINRGDGMPCPHCRVMLMRKWGCDWMRCPMCRTEICWVTRGPRWGPKGTGDVSGGCQCGINGRKCHPKCTYCH